MSDLEERKIKAVKETAALMKLYDKEVEKITEKLKQSDKFKYGLDVNSEEYALLNKEFDRKFAEVFEKYQLPPGTKLNLW